MKYALVTGGSRGIGRAICLKLTEMGYYILINFRSNITEAENTLRMIEAVGGSGELCQFDVSKQEEVEMALENWKKQHENDYIEVLINNAGIRKDTLLMWMENEHWFDVLDTNLNSFFYVTKALLKNMLINKHGRIINIVSLSGLKGLLPERHHK